MSVPTQSVTRVRKDTGHLLHLVLTILTSGLWGVLVWLPLVLWHKLGPKKEIVTTYR